ncbi:hypothetical protein PAPYR_11146 [Paratrimastix pyriformis]|uniref:Uncharacterized protein n=1 Tax=Paratrimastix pyriformis TaxID=342808 RepID=A0ABQ8U4E2_9EUKA|nr:hypothetical protein PAPYR_11146 [Paratrimastix pyriformis]
MPSLGLPKLRSPQIAPPPPPPLCIWQGYNSDGEIGLGSSVTSTDVFTKLAMPSGRAATMIACGAANLAAILNDGSLATCGLSSVGIIVARTHTKPFLGDPGEPDETAGRRACWLAFVRTIFIVSAQEEPQALLPRAAHNPATKR